MTPMRRLQARGREAAPLDLAKRDLTLVLGGRTFAVRAYQDGRAPAGPGWHAVVVEDRTPLRHTLAPTGDPEVCLAAAVRFLTAAVAADAADRRGAEAWESEGGALLGRGERGAAAPLGARRTTAP
jgi:hypothetical protein